jgi:GGDEF domain-containing protein
MAMQLFDRVDPSRLDRRELHLWVLALTVIFVLAMGVALLMYPTIYSYPLCLTGFQARAIFFGFCALWALLVGYLVDRQVVIRHLRRELEREKRQVAQIRQEASADLLTTLPGPDLFRDHLAMEYRRASSTQQPLSLLAVELKPARDLTDPGGIVTAFGDAAKALRRKLRGEDSMFLFAPGVFGIVLPAVDAGGAYSVRDHLMEGLPDAVGASNRFSLGVNVVNYPEHVATAREMEECVQSLLCRKAGKDSNMELLTPSLEIHERTSTWET